MSAARARNAVTSLASSGVLMRPFFVKIFIVRGLENIFATISAFFSGVLGRVLPVLLRTRAFAIRCLNVELDSIGEHALSVVFMQLFSSRLSCSLN